MNAPQKSDWLLVLIIWLAGLGAAAQYAKISVIYSQLGDHYAEAGAAFGFSVSLVGFIGIVFGVIAGHLVVGVGYRRALVGGLALGGLLSFFQALLPAFPVFLASRVIEGAAHLAIVVAAPTLIAQVTSEAGRGFALTLWGTFFGVAFAFLAWVGLPFALNQGLPALFVSHGMWMLAAAALLWVRLPGDAPAPARAKVSLVARHLLIYRSAYISAPAVGWLFYTFSFLSMLTFLPQFVDETWREFVRGAMPLISIIVSLSVGVWLLKLTSSFFVIQTGFLLSVVTLLLLLFFSGHPVLCLLFASGLGLVQGASFAAVPELNGSTADRALANGGLAQMGNLGNTLGTPVFALVIDAAGYGPMVILGMLALLGGAMAHLLLARVREMSAT